MNNSVQTIPLQNLALTLIPVLIVIAILYRWSLSSHIALYAVARMGIQLLLIGYVLVYIFESDDPSIVVAVLAVMLFASSWIALRPLKRKQPMLVAKALGSISLGGVLTLALVSQEVLDLQPWFSPRVMIPLAGMIFANAMNAVSLAAERFESESANNIQYEEARRIALRTSLIPQINSLLAVGLVSLPGMMTGQILSGVSPLVAVRYQIMVMCMVFGSGGISSACYLMLIRPRESELASNE